MSANARLAYNNLARGAGVVATASSEQAAFTRTRLLDEDPGLRWRSKLGWNPGRAFNDELLFTEGAVRRLAHLTPGNYATGALMAAQVQTAMNAAGVDPLSLSPSAWYRADSLLASVANGGSISTWNDDSGNGLHLSAILGSPTLASSVVNGRPAVLLDGTHYFRRTSVNFSTLLSAAGQGTVFVVFNVDSSYTTTYGTFWSNAGLTRAHWYDGASAAVVTRFQDGTSDNVSKSATRASWHIATWHYDGTGFCFLDDQDTAAGATVASGAQTDLGTQNLLIGFGGGPHYKGYLAELLFFPTALSEENRRRVTRYLVNKYGLTGDATSAPTWGNTYGASYGVSGANRFAMTRSAGGDAFGLPWTNATHVRSCGRDLGFDVTADDVGLAAYSGDYAAYKSREWLKVDLGSAQAVLAGIVVGHNLGAGGTITQQGHTVDDWASPGVSDVLAGDATIRLAYRASASKRWWRLLVDDVSTNPSGYTEIGIWFVGPYVEPAINYSVHFQRTPVPLSSVTRAISGAVKRDERPSFWSYQLSWLEVPEAVRAQLAAWVEACPVGVPFFLGFDPTNAPTDVVYGMFVAGTPQEQSSNLYWTVPLTVEEVLA